MTQTITIDSKSLIDYIKTSDNVTALSHSFIMDKITSETAAKEGITVTTEELQKAFNEFRLERQLHKANDTNKWLEKQSISLDDVEAMIKRKILSQKLDEHLFTNQIQPYFIQHELDYLGAIIYEIVLDDQDLAMDLYYSLQEQETTFWNLAHQYIKEPELRRKGGYRGMVNRKQLKPEISSKVFSAKPPEILKPITTSSGVHLILVEEIIKPQLDENLFWQIISDLREKWVETKTNEFEFKLMLN